MLLSVNETEKWDWNCSQDVRWLLMHKSRDSKLAYWVCVSGAPDIVAVLHQPHWVTSPGPLHT